MVESVSAVQSIPKPSPPKFTVYLVNDPYEVPATTPTVTIDPYTGEQKQVTPATSSYTVDNVTIQLWILNEQSSYSNGTTNFTPYFNVRTRGHFEENWTDLGYVRQKEYMPDSKDTRPYIEGYKAAQTGQKYTVLTYSSTAPAQYYAEYYSKDVTYPPNATLDFQVKVAIAHQAPVIRYETYGIIYSFPVGDIGNALDTQSEWSQTQSITINSNNTVLASTLDNPSKPALTPIPLPTDTPQPTKTATATTTPTPTNTPNTNKNPPTVFFPETLIIIPAIAIPIIAISILLYARKRKTPTPPIGFNIGFCKVFNGCLSM
jgi:hypothetical protein